MNMTKTDFILKYIKKYFGFLYEKNYKIQSVDYHPDAFGNWEVLFESSECVIQIAMDRDELFVEFIPLHGGQDNRIGLKSMIYYISQGHIFISSFKGNLFWGRKKQFERYSNLLREYIDQIAPYFGDDFYKYKDDLLSAQKRYNSLAIEKYIQEKK